MSRILKSAALAVGLAVILSLGGLAAGGAASAQSASAQSASAQSAAGQPAATAEPDISWQDKLTRQTGRVMLPEAKASLNLGDDYYFIGKEDARKVLVDGWGNPPDAANGVLGMIFPKKFKPLDDGSWGAVITYQDTGYVSDSDARTVDYDKLLADLKSSDDADNAERRKQGFPEITLIGWAEPPKYLADTHVVIWARELAASTTTHHALNYDIRVLGREGVLSLNVVAAMDDLVNVREAAASVARTAEFDSGQRYADYHEGVDRKANYGIAGLIAAGLGVAAAKKVGLLGVLLLFGKKLIIFIVAGFGALMAWLRRQFGMAPKAAKAPKVQPAQFGDDPPAVPPPSSTIEGGPRDGGNLIS